MGRAPLPLVAGFALFVAGIAGIVAASVSRPTVATFAPTARGGARSPGGVDTVTLDARDESRWVFFDLTLFFTGFLLRNLLSPDRPSAGRTVSLR